MASLKQPLTPEMQEKLVNFFGIDYLEDLVAGRTPTFGATEAERKAEGEAIFGTLLPVPGGKSTKTAKAVVPKITREMVEEMADDFVAKYGDDFITREELITKIGKQFENKEIMKTVDAAWKNINKGGTVNVLKKFAAKNRGKLIVGGLSAVGGISFLANWFINDNIPFLATKVVQQQADAVKWDGADPIEAEKNFRTADRLMQINSLWNNYLIYHNPILWGLREPQIAAADAAQQIIDQNKAYVTEEANKLRQSREDALSGSFTNPVSGETTTYTSDEKMTGEEKALQQQQSYSDAEFKQQRIKDEKAQQEAILARQAEIDKQNAVRAQQQSKVPLSTQNTVQYEEPKRKSRIRGPA